MGNVIRILLLADTHLGFDLPVNPRVNRRRRGHDFLANYATALQPAFSGEVDLVVHGGDVFNRSRPPSSVVWQAFEPLTRIADRGVPVYVVPGNHERGRIPHLRFAQHPGIHVFDGRDFVADSGVRVAVAVSSERDDVPADLPTSCWDGVSPSMAGDGRLLCVHQLWRRDVRTGDYTFTTAADVIRQRLPPVYAACCPVTVTGTGLPKDLRGRSLLPVCSGSIDAPQREATKEGVHGRRTLHEDGMSWMGVHELLPDTRPALLDPTDSTPSEWSLPSLLGPMLLRMPW